MKLYLSGGIAKVPDFVNIFASYTQYLMIHGYEVVNPVEIVPVCETPEEDGENSLGQDKGICLRTQAPAKPDDCHSWSCFLKWDLIEMLKCDGVAVIESTYWDSKGAILEVNTAFACGMPIKPVREWIAAAIKAGALDTSQRDSVTTEQITKLVSS